ncbi:MAG: signal peptidase I [Candidatus Woesearchaeota archaeon]
MMKLRRITRKQPIIRDVVLVIVLLLYAAVSYAGGYMTAMSSHDTTLITYDLALQGNNNDNTDTILSMPKDRINQDQITVLSDRVIIRIEEPQWATFAPTKSMVPFLDSGSHAIQIRPENHEDLQVGDIISYKSSFVDGIVIHRIIEIGYDNNGWYAIAKGDNNNNPDPERIRFSQIERVLVAIIY